MLNIKSKSSAGSFCYHTDPFRDYRDVALPCRSLLLAKDIELTPDILDLRSREILIYQAFPERIYYHFLKYELIININNNELSGTYRVDYLPKDDPKASELYLTHIS